MNFKKTIKIFLIDGEPNGRMYCDISNWSGRAFKIPRNIVKVCSDREELDGPGIYLLFGRDEEYNDKIYIGEAENTLKRLNQHLTNNDFWHETIVFISKDRNLNKAHVKYIENKLYNMTKSINRYSVMNTVVPTKSNISESDQAEMEEFTEYIKMLVSILGHKVFEPKRESNMIIPKIAFYLKLAGENIAVGAPTSDGFVVFSQSKATVVLGNSLTNTMLNLRKSLIEKGILVEADGFYIFAEDYIFSSPSTAAALLQGRSANGQIEWKLSDGTTLKAYESIDKKDL